MEMQTVSAQMLGGSINKLIGEREKACILLRPYSVHNEVKSKTLKHEQCWAHSKQLCCKLQCISAVAHPKWV